jgi:4-amino-4-deoxy-L-arabinose transferase-like glycosyltransferase
LTFLRQAALLLPSAFLLAVLLFLLTHGHQDPGFGTYPFFEQLQSGKAPASPEIRFIQQSLLFFVPAYAGVLLFILGISVAERGLFRRRRGEERARSSYTRAFGGIFAVLFLVASGVAVFEGEKVASRVAPGALVAPLLVAFAPFAGAAAAAIPAAVLALPLALARRRTRT